MRIGVLFPQNEIGADSGVIREYAQAVEEMGYTRILATDHVLGALRRLPEGETFENMQDVARALGLSVETQRF